MPHSYEFHDDFGELHLPEAMDFHLPGDSDSTTDPPTLTVLVTEDTESLYRQLICWCNVQRYWYVVLNTPQTSDVWYDFIENFLLEMERETPYLKDTNKYAPGKKVASSRPEDYPNYIRHLFYQWEQRQKNLDKQKEKFDT